MQQSLQPLCHPAAMAAAFVFNGAVAQAACQVACHVAQCSHQHAQAGEGELVNGCIDNLLYVLDPRRYVWSTKGTARGDW